MARLDLLEEVGLGAFALQFFTGTADRLELGVVHCKERTIHITANLAFASVDEAVEGVLKDVSVKTIFKGVTPFWVADIFRLALLALVPSIALLLPSMM